MILEMNYEAMSVKELCLRAKINRKTFYAYYADLDKLLETFQNQVADEFIKRVKHLQLPGDLSAIIKEFFLLTQYTIHYMNILCAAAAIGK